MVACASSKTREASHQTFLNYCSCYITAHQNSLLSAVTQRSGECFSVVPLRLSLSFFFFFSSVFPFCLVFVFQVMFYCLLGVLVTGWVCPPVAGCDGAPDVVLSGEFPRHSPRCEFGVGLIAACIIGRGISGVLSVIRAARVCSYLCTVLGARCCDRADYVAVAA